MGKNRIPAPNENPQTFTTFSAPIIFEHNKIVTKAAMIKIVKKFLGLGADD